MVKERILLRKRKKFYPLYPYEDAIPDGDDSRSLGSTTIQWKNVYIDATGFLDQISLAGHLTPEVDEATDLGSSTLQLRDVHIDRTGYIDQISLSGNLIPEKDNFTDIGSSAKELNNIYVDGSGFIDTLRVDDDIRAPQKTSFARSGAGSFYVKPGARPYIVFYASSTASYMKASAVLHTGA